MLEAGREGRVARGRGEDAERATASIRGVREADPRLRAIYEHTFQLISLLSVEGTVLDANHAALAAAGLSLDAVVGRPFWEVGWFSVDGEVQSRVRDAVGRAAAGEFVRLELEAPLESDAGLTYDFSLKPVADEGGDVAFLIAEGRDITEAKWAERALRLSEAKFAGIISIASDAIISVDESFRITLFNRGAESIFGYTPAEAMGQSLDLLLPERFRGAHGRHMRNFAASPVVARRMGERQEILGRRKDGTEFPAEASISKLELFGSRLFTVVLRDITERKRTERAQRFLAQAGAILASSLDYETTLASVTGLTVPELADWCVVYIREAEGHVRRLEVAHADAARTQTLRQLLRYPLDPRLPHPVFAVLETGAPEVIAEVGDDFLRALSLDEQHFQIYRTLGFASMLMVPLIARGETHGAMGFFSERAHRYGPEEVSLGQDLALLAALAVDNARLYRDAQRAVQARDDLISVVSHDLGNPLSAIRIGTTLLLRTVPETEQEQGGWKHLEFIRQSAEQMERLINDLLDVKRLEAGRVTLQLRDVSVVDVVDEVLEVFAPIARGKQVELRTEFVEPLPLIAADHQRLNQVVSNLVGNAVKFTDGGGSVTVGARAAGSMLLVTVADTGCGIATEHLPHVFDRFWQAERHGRKGLGLGLAIARGIVEAHGGRIWVESVPAQGTTFLFTLPLPE